MGKVSCADCGGRIRPPDRPWTETGDERVIHFYDTTLGAMKAYAREMVRVAKRTPMVHEGCTRPSEPHIVAMSLEARLQVRRRSTGAHWSIMK